jgi:hypothetical protein
MIVNKMTFKASSIKYPMLHGIGYFFILKMAYIRFKDNFIQALDIKTRNIIDLNASLIAKCYQLPL